MQRRVHARPAVDHVRLAVARLERVVALAAVQHVALRCRCARARPCAPAPTACRRRPRPTSRPARDPRRSCRCPAPPYCLSSPCPPPIRSLPSSPQSWSAPSPPHTRSSPSPPYSRSAPTPAPDPVAALAAIDRVRPAAARRSGHPRPRIDHVRLPASRGSGRSPASRRSASPAPSPSADGKRHRHRQNDASRHYIGHCPTSGLKSVDASVKPAETAKLRPRRAPRLGPGGRALYLPARPGGVAQLVRAPACHAGGRGFESRRSRRNEKLCTPRGFLRS